MKVCPYCHQDDLWRASIARLEFDTIVCGECDTAWMLDEAITDGNGVNLEAFMASHGKEADWSTVQLKVKI